MTVQINIDGTTVLTSEVKAYEKRVLNVQVEGHVTQEIPLPVTEDVVINFNFYERPETDLERQTYIARMEEANKVYEPPTPVAVEGDAAETDILAESSVPQTEPETETETTESETTESLPLDLG